MLSFAQHKGREGKGRGGSTWWVLVAGKETKECLSTWPRAAAAAAPSVVWERECSEREQEEEEEGRGMQRRRRVVWEREPVRFNYSIVLKIFGKNRRGSNFVCI